MPRRALLAIFAIALAAIPAVVSAGEIAFDRRTARSGNWSDPGTWTGGRPPGAGENVQVRPGHVVVYDAHAGAPVRTLHVAGVLRFSREKSTLLAVGLLKVTPGEQCTDDGFACHPPATPPAQNPGAANPAADCALEIGTAADPIPPGVTATLRLTHFEGMDAESLPALMSCGGRMDIHGAPLSRTWLKLGADAKKGDATVTLEEPVTGWRVGDRVIVTASKQHYGYADTFRPRPGKPAPQVGTEQRVVTKVDGATLTLDRPLEVAHRGSGAYRAEVANLSRNVVVESADPAGVRGHTMYHDGSTGGIGYAEFRHLGKEGVLGRYAIHFHLAGDGMRGSGVVGASVWDSHNRWITVHGTDYLLVRDNVGYQSVGHGFFLEDGTEQYNVFDRNLAVQAFRGKPLKGQALGFDANDGAGFWWAAARNTFVRNVSCENDRYGYKFELRGKSGSFDPEARLRTPDGTTAAVDLRTVPFLRFESNEAHCDGLYAMNFGDETDKNPGVRGDRHHPFVARDLKVWESHYVLRPNLQYFLLDGLDAWNSVYGVYHPDYDAHVYRNLRLDNINAEPINRGLDDADEQRGTFTYENLSIENCRTGRDPLIQMSVTSPRPGQAGHFRNVTVTNSKSRSNVVDLGGGPRNERYEHGVAYYFHDFPAAGQTTRVVSARDAAGEAGAGYGPVKDFTGKDVRAATVAAVPFPALLDPVDDLPPATMIRSIVKSGDGWRVTGVTQDNGDLAAVVVNGKTAGVLASRAGVTDWQVDLPAPADGRVVAHATDRAGNVEKLAHSLPAGR